MGFPLPGDAIEPSLNLNQHLIHNPAATFFMRVEGDMTADQEVQPGDLLVIDRSVPAQDGSLVVAALPFWAVL
jgi:DNA polymerase V